MTATLRVQTGAFALAVAALGSPVLTAAAVDAADRSPVAAVGAQLIPDQYIVMLDRTALGGALSVLDTAQTLLASVGGGRILAVYEHALDGFAVRMTPIQAQLLSALPGVLRVEQDQAVFLSATQANPVYNLDRIDQRNLPLNQSFSYPDGPGQGTHVYIIDTGLNVNHVDFSGRVGNGRNFATHSSGGLLGGGGTVDPNNLSDCNGHGTHVAGTAAGTTYGAAKSATVHAVRVFGCGNSSSNSIILSGIDWTTANHIKPAVANLSLGGGASTATDTAIRNLINSGVTAVVAAGNDNANACNYSPAREPAAVTVGSTTNTDARSSFSNFGTCLDLFAPGSNIVSASNSSNTGTRTLSGTSMAAPLTAGVAAIYLGRNPGASPATVAAALVADSTPNVVGSAGSGSPNRLLYVAQVDGGPPVDNPPVAAYTFSCTALSCSFNAGGSTDDVGIAAYDWNFGDGSQGTGATVSHSYAAAGSYSVTLTVTDTANQTDTEIKSVTVSEAAAAPCSNCTKYTGNLAGTGSTIYHPGSGSFSHSGGALNGYLRGPAGSNFDVYLERRGGFLVTSWSVVASNTGAGSTHDLNVNATSGTYRWRITSAAGGGTYEFYGQPR